MGVHSRSCETSIKIYEGRSRYCDWKFMLREQPGGRRGGGAHTPRNPRVPTGPRDDGGKDPFAY